MPCRIFATDIAEDALEEATLGLYLPEKLEQVTLGRLESNFTREHNRYRISAAIRENVHFSRYDMLDTRTYVPPECLFGNFDLILCRNFVMYLDAIAAEQVFDKLYKALAPHGVLMLGTAETPAAGAGRVLDPDARFRLFL